MLVLRPIREADLASLVGLADSIGGGLTTLPHNEDFLSNRIDESLRAFSPRVKRPGGELYLFGFEDTTTGEVIGVSGIASRVGGFDPWYSYEIKPERFVHAPLKVDREIRTLHLKREHRGPSEVCSLFLRADRRRGGAGRLLSLGRFLFMGAFPKRFTPTVIAEMRGYIDQTGKSPFWEAVGRQFYQFDFYSADVLSGLGDKDFIADLNPRHPLYIPLLAPEVQAVIGRVHHDTEPALALLRAEGFKPIEEVDIFDAGPVLQSTVGELRTLRQNRVAKIRSASAKVVNDKPLLLANGALDFRACLGTLTEHEDGTVSVSPETATALNLDAGDKIWFTPPR
ncbi:MAG: arginine N-succinyltransferase [Candidatus Didemnitutus sp.]|nr:arginine N-succinyltransferase [Candidatus Didemnitutus sp.]